MSIFEKGLHIDPKYQHLEKYVHIMYRGFWTPAKYEKLIAEVDVPHFNNVLAFLDKEVIRRCILAVSIVEDKVKTYWSTLALDIPQTIVGDVGGLFGQSEVTHRRSYHSLAQYLGVSLDEIDNHEALKGRVAYLTKYLENDPKIIGKKRILKKLVLFTSLVERCSLFTQFYILMSYAYNNKGLKTISALQESTAIEEVTHYNFGVDVINIIKLEHPQLWDEYLIELITDNIKVAYQSELNLIDWFFENGVPSHLTKEEVVNFLNYNFNVVCKDLEIDLQFEVDEVISREKNAWFKAKVFMTTEPDFFDNAVSGYASEEEDVNMDTFKF
jgi:ribonucleotide reductase beta subunit family protein with ferritin-like domain